MDAIKNNWALIVLLVLVYLHHKKLWIFAPKDATPVNYFITPAPTTERPIMFFDTNPATYPTTDATSANYRGAPILGSNLAQAGGPTADASPNISGFSVNNKKRKTPFLYV